jgi:chorismate lyase/3-hydroxybenzoate synthase
MPDIAAASLRVDFTDEPIDSLLAADDTLALIGFGSRAPHNDDPRYLRVALEPLGAAPFERWRAAGPVMRGREGDGRDALAWAENGTLQFGALELDEGDNDIELTAATIYARMLAFTQVRGYPHLLRTWNYLDGITCGDGDAERYRRFCVGRARGIGDVESATLPAATAIGRVDGARRLQVYWLASNAPGTPLENPRQVSAYRYPRQYGPQPPSFARAMLPPSASMPLLLSGTAAVVGHESRHAESVAAQLDETLLNFDSLLGAAHKQRPGLPAHFGPQTRLKVYVRDHEEVAEVTALLQARLDPSVPRLVVHAAICRRELRIEIDGTHY